MYRHWFWWNNYNLWFAAPLLSCNFERDLCNWQQDKTENLDWTRDSGGTASSGTGPSFDHTTGGKSGYYIYTEASVNNNKTARLLSPPLQVSTIVCVNFWYHMYGANVNRINLRLKHGGALGQPLWTKIGNQGNRWFNAKVDVMPQNGDMVCWRLYVYCFVISALDKMDGELKLSICFDYRWFLKA